MLCITKSCHAKDKDGKALIPIVTEMKRIGGLYRDITKFHCNQCGKEFSQATEMRTRQEYRAWKDAQEKAMKAMNEKLAKAKLENSLTPA